MAGKARSSAKRTTAEAESHGRQANAWRDRYSQRHRPHRIKDFPTGIVPPKKVRIYSRREHHLLQWWDPGEKRTLSERVDGDLIDAIARARTVEERLSYYRSSGRKPRKRGHPELVARYDDDLHRRADAGEVDPATVQRYGSTLQRHYLAFVEQADIGRRYPHISSIDREFQLEFTAYLNNVKISPNGSARGAPRSMKGKEFVLDVVRAMLEWASDPDRGNLLPDGFRNPFKRRARKSQRDTVDLLGDPEISISMAQDLLTECDTFQLAIFAPLLLYGLRPGELGWLFWEHIEDGWLRVPCIPELGYQTKGRRDKRFPIVDCVATLWQCQDIDAHGLLYAHRRAVTGSDSAVLLGSSLADLVVEYETRCHKAGQIGAAQKRRIRDQLMKDAGQLSYDRIRVEFDKLASKLSWPSNATLKDLRHLFSTSLENAGVPEFFRRYLMGHSFGRAPIVTYTHLGEDKLRQHYERALRTEFDSIVRTIAHRIRELGLKPVDDDSDRPPRGPARSACEEKERDLAVAC